MSTMPMPGGSSRDELLLARWPFKLLSHDHHQNGTSLVRVKLEPWHSYATNAVKVSKFYQKVATDSIIIRTFFFRRAKYSIQRILFQSLRIYRNLCDSSAWRTAGSSPPLPHTRYTIKPAHALWGMRLCSQDCGMPSEATHGSKVVLMFQLWLFESRKKRAVGHSGFQHPNPHKVIESCCEVWCIETGTIHPNLELRDLELVTIRRLLLIESKAEQNNSLRYNYC